MESSDDGDPGPSTTYKVVSRVLIPQKSIVIQTLQVKEPVHIIDNNGKPTICKAGDTRVEVMQHRPEGPRKIQWLERGWHSKRTVSNFMKAFHYSQRLEQVLKRPEYAVYPEVVDRELLRRII